MKIGKTILSVLIILFITSGLYPQQYWLTMNSPVRLDLKKCCFIDSLNGWVAGDSGLVMKTTNGGQNWVRQNAKTKNQIHEVFFLNKRLGWALSWNIFNPTPPYGTLILKTTDGGVNWDTTSFPTENVYIRTVFFQDSLYGFMGGTFRNIMRTTDGGANWLDVTIDSMIVSYFPVNNFNFYNNNFGYASGGQIDFAGILWKTTNRGIRWTPYLLAPEPMWNVSFLDSLRILGLCGDFEYGPSIVTTTNAGTNWKYVYLGFFGFPSAMAFRTNNEVWAPLGFARAFIYSIDTGFTWTEYTNPDTAEVNHVVFPDSRHGYAVCQYGLILKYNNTLIGINNQNTTVTNNYTLHQNYPNPFNPATNISYELKSNSFVVLKIYDLTGKEVKTLFNGYQNNGKYNLKFSGENLSSGIYFYEITARDLTGKSNNIFRETKKMILLK